MAGVAGIGMVGFVVWLARLVLAAGIGCMVFTAVTTLILADSGSPVPAELAAALGVVGIIGATGGFAVDRLVHVIRIRRVKPVRVAQPSWHNQPAGRPDPGKRPPRRPALQAPTGWWSVLGVARDAPPAVFESAARGLLRQYHPDRWVMAAAAQRQEAETRTRAILQALAEARTTAR